MHFESLKCSDRFLVFVFAKFAFLVNKVPFVERSCVVFALGV
jgi:hypothetical protein